MNQEFHTQLKVIDAQTYNNWDQEVFEELRAGGVTCVHVTCATWEGTREALNNISRWYRLFREYNNLIVPAYSASDIDIAKTAGKTAIIMGCQNTSPLEGDLGLVEVFYHLGIRIIQLTYNNQSLVGGGCYEANDSGLSRFGHEVVREMNRLGIIIDLSHVGERTSLETIDVSTRPVAITHSNPYWFYAHRRNKSDQVLKALAQKGGVLGLTIYPLIIGGHEVALTEYCDMIARTVDLIGIDYVGFGTDLTRKRTYTELEWTRMGRWTFTMDRAPRGSTNESGWPRWPNWFRSSADFPNLTAGLLDKGFSQAEVAKIMGENWLRLFTEGFEPLERS